jgi:seryl-tRNA synthetase
MSSAEEGDAQSFHDALVAHGLIIPVGVAGAFGRGAVFEDVLSRFDALVLRIGDHPAEVAAFPPVINRRVLEQVSYLDSFPHLCGAVHSFFGDAIQALALAERARSGGAWGELLGPTQVVMNPAACYPLYPSLAGVLPADGRVVTMMNWVFRHEPSPEATRMQSFRVREYVRAGAPDTVLAWRDRWLQRGSELLASLGLSARADIAADPFFGRRGKMMGASQKEQKLKFELLVPVISALEPTALCSFNYHQDKFSAEFDIRTADGAIAHTACLGFGLERVVMALFKAHGFDPAAWPVSVRRLLWD